MFGIKNDDNVALSFAAQIIYVASLWAILAFLTKFTTAREVGVFSMCSAIVTPIFMLLNFDARQAKTSDVNGQNSIHEYLWLRFYTNCCSAVIVVAVSFFTDDLYLSLALIGFLFSKFFESMSDMCVGAYYLHKKMQNLFVSMFLRSMLGMASFILSYLYFKQIWISFAFQAIVLAIIFLYYDLYNAQKFEFNLSRKQYIRWAFTRSFSNKKIYDLLKDLFPLGAAIFFVSLQVQAPKYFVYNYYGLESAGIFAALFYCVTAAGILLMPLESILIRHFSGLLAAGGHKQIIGYGIRYIVCVAILALVSLPFFYSYSGFILKILYSDIYAQHSKAFFLLTLVIFLRFLAVFMQSLLLATRQFYHQPILQLSVLLAFALIGFILIPTYGIIGASYSVIGATIFRLFVLGFMLKRIKL